MTKFELRTQIRRFVPTDELAADMNASYKALTDHLAKVSVEATARAIADLRDLDPGHPLLKNPNPPFEDLVRQAGLIVFNAKANAAAERSAPSETKPVDLEVLSITRDNGDTLYVFRPLGPQKGPASSSHSAPVQGSRVVTSVVDGVTVMGVVAAIRDWDPVTAGDLQHLEKFDPRRVYATPNGTNVVFKRVDAGMTVLWSYKTQGEIKIGANVVLVRTDRQAEPTASSGSKRMTQRVLAAYLIAQDPDISAKELTEALSEAFPEAVVGRRHGAHYLSHSRNGRLPEAPATDPRTWPR
jgi:hypothetical protein